jgi:two-component system CheB/CheR fusion protein
MSSEREHFESLPTSADATGLEDLLGYLGRTRGFDFTAYKRPSLTRRIQKRMAAVAIASPGEYVDFLETHPDEFRHLFNTILINVTAFFRDDEPWDVLATLLPAIVANRAPDEPIRVWSAGCASGEEAYTVAMLLAEIVGTAGFSDRVKIYATDVDEDALGEARQGMYGPRQIEGVAPDLRAKYFRPQDGLFVFDKELRRAVIFGRNNLIQDAPISRLALLICRNTLMYFNSEAQARILSRFSFALADDGILVLGKAEMLLTRSELFAPVDLRSRLFRKIPRPGWPDRIRGMLTPRQPEARSPMPNLPDIYAIAFESAPIAHIVVDAAGTLAMYNDRARTLFGLKPLDVGRPFHELELSYRPVELRSLIHDAQEQRRPIVVKEVQSEAFGRQPRSLDVQVTPLLDPQGHRLGASVTFADSTRVLELQQQLSRSKQDLETTYEELQSTNEELETTNEELQSTVEELETTNEELQSTNEELETMNEELHSTNEELQSINVELRDRGEMLNHVNHFLESVMRGMRGAVIVVNRDLNVIAWNHRSEDMWGLRAEEVRNKNVFGLDIGLPVDQLRRAIRSCLNGDADVHDISLSATNRRGKPVECKVTCTPLKGQTQVDGAILMIDEFSAPSVKPS